MHLSVDVDRWIDQSVSFYDEMGWDGIRRLFGDMELIE